MALTRYNVRVYGLCFNRKGQVLLTDERRGGYLMTKFPGGGHELGEGLGDCVRREFMEEMNLEVETAGLYYVNDFLQISAFNPEDQIISAYYLVQALNPLQVVIVENRYEFPAKAGDAQTFRWAEVETLGPKDLSFPIDRVVLEMLQQDRQSGNGKLSQLIAASLL